MNIEEVAEATNTACKKMDHVVEVDHVSPISVWSLIDIGGWQLLELFVFNIPKMCNEDILDFSLHQAMSIGLDGPYSFASCNTWIDNLLLRSL